MADRPSPRATPDEMSAQLHDLLSTLWSRSRATIGERLDVLRVTLRSLRINPADAQAKKTGADAAHKLAGILGTFGLPEGTELARRTEVMLESSAAIRSYDLDRLQQDIELLHQMIEAKSRDAGKRRA